MRILVVEDEPRLLRNLAKALREEGYAVDTAETGDDGLYKAESYSYDAIVLDVMLPRLDGWEVLERLRKQKPTPVLMLTARDAHKDRVRGLDTGADDYLVKPFDLTELLARLRALIRRAAGQARPNLELRDVFIDTRARSVTRGGQPVTMTAREYAILEYLALHRGEVVSRTALYRSEEHTSELQSRLHLVCRLLLEKKKTKKLPSPPPSCPPRTTPLTKHEV